jgi:hypothetical protein
MIIPEREKRWCALVERQMKICSTKTRNSEKDNLGFNAFFFSR